MNCNKKKCSKVLMFLGFSMLLMDNSYSGKLSEKEGEAGEKKPSYKKGKSYRPSKKPIPDIPLVKDPLAGKPLKYDSGSGMYYYGEIIEETGEKKSESPPKPVRKDATGLVFNLNVEEYKTAQALTNKKTKRKPVENN